MKNYFTFLFLIPLLSFSQSHSEVLNSFLNSENLKQANVGLSIYNLSQNKSVLTHQENKLLLPASLQKLLTTTAAIDILGKDFRFSTKIELNGIQNGLRFTGVLNIISGGDPSIDKSFINAVYDFLKEKNISIFEGYIVVDESKYSNIPPQTWLLEDVANYYGSPAYGFNFLQNTYKLNFTQKSEGNRPDILSTNPYMRHLQFDNNLVCKGKKDNAYIIGLPFSKERKIVGSIPPGTGTFTIKGAIDNPAQIFKNMLIKKFQEEQFGFVFNTSVDSNNKLYTKEVKSATLDQMLKETNLKSNNLYAEALLNAVAIKKYGFASELNGIKALQNYFNSNELLVYDGSGLSRKNKTSASFLMKLMKTNSDNEIFKNSLGVSGISGTMKYLYSEKSKGKFKGKSGSADGILNYAAYFKDTNGELFAFVIIVNNYKGSRSSLRKEMLKILEQYL